MMNPRQVLFTLFCIALAIPMLTYAKSDADFTASSKSMRSLLGEMVKANTSNPPGDESKITRMIAKRFKAAGIDYEITEFAPKRENLVARLKASKPGGLKPALVIAHIDVVGTNQQSWTVPPHEMTEKDGYLYGRGVLDDLGMAAAMVETAILLKQSKVPLKRDIIFAFTGDEETSGAGVRYILKNRPESLDAAFVLNEGGGIRLGKDGKTVEQLSLQVAEKIYQDFKVVAKGTTGHSSVPRPDNAILELSKALQKIDAIKKTPRLLPVTREYFKKRSAIETNPTLANAMKTLANSKGKLPEKAVKDLQTSLSDAASLWTTCTPTLVNGGTRINALPAEATAQLNCRILPDETVEEVFKKLKDAVAGLNVEVSPMDEVGKAQVPSPLSGEAAQSIEKIFKQFYPKATIIPSMSKGMTDSRFFRAQGMPAYGINPLPFGEDDGGRAHGIDERIPAASLESGLRFLYALLEDMAGA